MFEGLSPFLGFILATAVGLGLSITTFFVVSKSGLSSYQATLIETLQSNGTALKARVDLLESQIDELNQVKDFLEKEIGRLRDAISDLATENSELRRQLGLKAKEDHNV